MKYFPGKSGKNPLIKDTSNSVLIVTCNGSRPDSYIKESKEVIITPKHIKEIIMEIFRDE